MNLLKFWYKCTNKKKYRDLKNKLSKEKKLRRYNGTYSKIIEEIIFKLQNQTELNFKHSGHLGDIVYSLPVIQELSKSHVCNLFIHAEKPMKEEYYKHPSGNVMLSKNIISKFLPLLQHQHYLHKAEFWNDEKIDIDLDLFRDLPIDFNFLSHRWYFHIAGIQPDLSQKYLEIPSHEVLKDKVVIVRSLRAQNHFVDYSFLKKYENLLFIGIKEEYEDLKNKVPNLEFYDVKDFYEMAQIIKASKFFLGNQSFAYSIADGLKVPRLLEANPDFAVVYPIGENAYDFYFQQHFELYFDKLYNS